MAVTITKTGVIEAASEVSGVRKSTVVRVLDAVLENIKDAVHNGDTVQLTGFGTFHVTKTKARTGRNPRTGEPLHIPAGHRASFTPGTQLKEAASHKK